MEDYIFTSDEFKRLAINNLEQYKFTLTADWKVAVRVFDVLSLWNRNDSKLSPKIDWDSLHIDGNITNYNSLLQDIWMQQKSDSKWYWVSYLTNKTLANCQIWDNKTDSKGSIRILTRWDWLEQLQIYRNSAWSNILSWINLKVDLEENVADIEFTDFIPYETSLISWFSDAKDPYGNHMIAWMGINIWAFGSPVVFDWGTF